MFNLYVSQRFERIQEEMKFLLQVEEENCSLFLIIFILIVKILQYVNFVQLKVTVDSKKICFFHGINKKNQKYDKYGSATRILGRSHSHDISDFYTTQRQS